MRETEIMLPMYILKDRKLTVLEAVITYLKNKGMKYSEIARRLDRDQRNIRTICTGAMKKLKDL